MPLIEGVGDEVVQFFAVVLILLVGIVAWLSTGLSDRQIIRTVLILERRSRHRVLSDAPVSQPSTATTSLEGSIDTGQAELQTPDENHESEVVATCHPCDKENSSASSSSSEITNISSSEFPETNLCDLGANHSIVEPTTSSAPSSDVCIEEVTSSLQDSSSESAVLRRRRLAFFQSRQATLLDQPDTEQLNSSSSSSSEAHVDATNSSKTPVEKDKTPEPSSSSANPSSQGNIRIRLKYLNDDQKLVEGRLEEQLGDFKRRHFALEMAADKLVRLIFNGQVLQSDSETLQDYGLFDNCVVHCLVHKQRSSPNQGTEGARNTSSSGGNAQAGDGLPQREWDLGNILFASLSIILGLAWYCRYQYAQLFNATTTVALVGLTGILTVSLVGIYLPDPDGIRQ
ncbi:transmembrane and ubiquitin-like domain-containing protein 1 [Anabrus simplex]|uniref:transmembrane and ubiquitin-like domain-containing protein 1 n=1 Tax=Anabrus simplex TaxID=316456 RepID=UPI0035A3B81B